MNKPKPLDPEMVFKLAAMACTVEEIADVCGFSRSQFFARKESNKKDYKHPETGEMVTLDELISSGRSQGRVSLRRAQFKAALDGNVTAMIWLGKQWLGQKESPVEISGKIDVEERASLEALNVDELQHLYRLRKKMDGSTTLAEPPAKPVGNMVLDVTKLQ